MTNPIIIDFNNSLVQMGGVVKRLPVRLVTDVLVSQIMWDGAKGAVYFNDQPSIPFTDENIVKPFADMFDIEPPQIVPERIGAYAQFDRPDTEWLELVARHEGATITIAALIEAAIEANKAEGIAKTEAEAVRRKTFQAEMNAKRRALGRPEREYRDGDSFAVVAEGAQGGDRGA